MGGKSKQSQRTKNNVRPSSSGRSAELLNNAVRMDSGLMAGGAKGLPVLFPTLAAPLDAGLNPDLALCFKKLTKKDPITKTKALQELCELVKKTDVEELVGALGAWAHHYRALGADPDHKVREAAQVAQGAWMAACGRRAAPALRLLLPAWLRAQHDDHAPAAAAARAALQATFPESKLPDVISFCKEEVIAHLLENLVGDAEAALSKKNLTPEEKEVQHARLVAGSLQGLEYFTQQLARAHDAWLWAQLAPLLRAAAFWRLPAARAPPVRTAWYGALGRIIARFEDTFGAEYGAKAARQLLGGGGGAPAWGCLLLLMHHVKDWHTWVDKKDLLTKRIIDVLENGGWGDAKHLSSMLLPLLAYLPEQLLTREFYESFFDAVFKGLEKKAVMSSKSERQSWITSLSECLRYLTVQQRDYAVEVATAVHRAWLARVLAGAPDTPTANNLIKHSAANMVSLVKYWMKQSKEPNGEKFDQLVRNFWQNVGSTAIAQIDRLSTERSDIDTLVRAHILLLQSLKTSFAQDVKRAKSIKFTDEKRDATEPSEEPLPRCDAAVADRFKHNLDEVVQRVAARYFEFARDQQVAGSVFAPLLTLLIEFDDEDLFTALARHFDADSAFGLYDGVLRGWLADDTLRCREVAETVFLLMKHLPESEQEAVMDSFEQFPAPAAEWCTELCLSHPYRGWRAARRWLRAARAAGALRAAAGRALGGDARARGLLLLALAGDEREELMVSESTVSEIVSLVSAALDPAADGLEQRAALGAALAGQLGAAPAGRLGGAPDCGALALALFQLQLQIPRGDPRLAPDTWCELRGAWQDAGAAAPDFCARAVDAARRQLALMAGALDIPRLEHVAALCPYLLAQFDAGRGPPAGRAAAELAARLLPDAPPAAAPARAAALRLDCLRGRLSCLFEDDDGCARLAAERPGAEAPELSEAEALAFASALIFEAAFLRALALRRDEGERPLEAWLAARLARALHDHAVLTSLRDGYAFWPHYDIISRAHSHLELLLGELVGGVEEAGRARLAELLGARAATAGYYWSCAAAAFRARLAPATPAAPETPETPEATATPETSETPAPAADVQLEDVLTGNGYFHSLQAEARASGDREASLRAKYLVMLRSFYVAHAQSAVIDEQFAREAAAGRARLDLDVIVNAYYRHQHTMLYDCDISRADWRQVVSNAAIVDYLTEMVEAAGWTAPAQHWDFTTITLCSLATSLHKSMDHWGTTKVALLARAVLALFGSVARFVGGVRAECERRAPAAHVAALPAEWRDIFAPDLAHSLLGVLLRVLASAGPELSAPRAAVVGALLAAAPRLDWLALAPARRAAELAVPALARAACAALGARVHHGYQYLAHALLLALAEPLVLHDAGTLAACADDGGSEDEPAARGPLALRELLGPLARLLARLEGALQAVRLGEETCSLEPRSADHCTALGALLLADAACGAAGLARADLVHHYLELFREERYVEQLVAAALRLLPPEAAAHALDASAPAPAHCTRLFLEPPALSLDEPSSAGAVGALACRALYHCAHWAGGALRGWWAAAPGRAARALERLLRAHVSPALVRAQLRAAAAGAAQLPDAEVTVLASTREVACALALEERTLRLTVALGAAHPLQAPRVAAPAGPAGPAGPAAHCTQWLAVYLAYQNGSVLSALRMWADAAARRVAAAPQCYICYCRLHPASGRLPRVPCHQCRNKFHAQCLRKWFTSSSKSNCPLCRAVF